MSEHSRNSRRGAGRNGSFFTKRSSEQLPAKTPKRPAYLWVGRRVWRHPSVLALVDADGRGRDPILVIRDRARALVAEARRFGWSGPPFDPRALASLRGIRLSPDRLAPGHDAFIVPREGQQLEIVFDTDRPSTRQNFSICHEVCHTLFPDGYEMVRHRCERQDRFDPDREVEQLCDMGAAEILLPEEEFLEDLRRFGLGLAAVASLRERYQASREAVIRRMIQLDEGRSAVVFLEYRLKPSEQAAAGQITLLGPARTPRRKLRIGYTVTSNSFGLFLPRHKSIPETSCVYRAALNDKVTFGIESWDIQGLPSCHVEAMAIPPGEEADAAPRVVALLRL